MIPIYLAGASAEFERVKYWADAITETKRAGITFRWFDRAHEWTGQDHLLARDLRRMHAHADMRAIRAARVFWLLAPTLVNPGSGAYTELGLALMHRHHMVAHPWIVVSGEQRGIFSADADECCSDDAAGFRAVVARIELLSRLHLVAP
jgi:hypothetical protein